MTTIRLEEPRKLRHLLQLLGVMALAAVVNFYGLSLSPLWLDEASALAFASQNLDDLWGERARLEVNPPLYFTLLHWWLGFGTSEAALRSLSAVIGILAVLPVYGIGRILGGTRAGLLAGLLFASAPFFVYFAQEARSYVLLNLAATTAIFGLYYLLTDPQRALRPIGSSLRGSPSWTPAEALRSDLAWLAYLLGTATALYSHNTGAFLPLATNMVAVVWWFLRGETKRQFVFNWVAANALPFLLWLWWLPSIVEQSASSSAEAWWFPVATPEQIVQSARSVFGQGYLTHALPFISPLPHLVLPLALVWGLWTLRHRLLVAAPVLFIMAAVPVLMALTSYVVPMWGARILIWPAALAFVVVAFGLASIANPLVRRLLIGVVLAVQVGNLVSYYGAQTRDRVHFEPWDDFAAALASRAGDGDAIVFLRVGGVSAVYDYYNLVPQLPRYSIDSFGLPERADRTAPMVPPEQLGEIVARYDRVWGVGRICQNQATCHPWIDLGPSGGNMTLVWQSRLLKLYKLEKREVSEN